jgi:hypothetical protein
MAGVRERARGLVQSVGLDEHVVGVEGADGEQADAG